MSFLEFDSHGNYELSLQWCKDSKTLPFVHGQKITPEVFGWMTGRWVNHDRIFIFDLFLYCRDFSITVRMVLNDDIRGTQGFSLSVQHLKVWAVKAKN